MPNREISIDEQLDRGFAGLVFSGRIEEDFRKYYSETSINRASLLPIFAIIMTSFALAMRLSATEIKLAMVIFDITLYLPILCTTLYLSNFPDRYRLYQLLLAASGMLSGLVILSIVFRANIHGVPYYFAMEVACIFSIWLTMCLTFRRAATIALAISLGHLIGVFQFDTDFQQAGFEIVMLLLVNGIGALSGYQLEYSARRIFLESRAHHKKAGKVSIVRADENVYA